MRGSVKTVFEIKNWLKNGINCILKIHILLQIPNFKINTKHCIGVEQSADLIENVLWIDLKFFNWSIVDLQCCANLCCAVSKVTQFYMYTHFFFTVLFYYDLSQEVRYSSLC